MPSVSSSKTDLYLLFALRSLNNLKIICKTKVNRSQCMQRLICKRQFMALSPANANQRLEIRNQR